MTCAFLELILLIIELLFSLKGIFLETFDEQRAFLRLCDAIVLDLPVNPLCSDDCPGLCPECGGKWAELPADHAHEVIDARWAGLNRLDLE